MRLNLAALSVLFMASEGLAQTPTTAQAPAPAPPPQTDSERARASFEQGIAALQGGRMHDASGAFEESYQLSPFPVVLYNLGLARRGEGRTVDAVEAFERYLLSPESDAAPELLATVRHEAARLRGQLAGVHLTVSTPRAMVTLDGLVPSRPFHDLLVNPGVHILEVSASGFRTRRIQITLGAGERETQQVTLEIPLRLTVSPNVTEAAVSVDGQLQGLGVTVVSLEAGFHRVEVRAAGYISQQRGLIAGSTGSMRLEVALPPMPPPPTASRPWLAPMVFGGAGLGVAVGVVIAGVLLAPASIPEYTGRWGTVRQ